MNMSKLRYGLVALISEYRRYFMNKTNMKIVNTKQKITNTTSKTVTENGMW